MIQEQILVTKITKEIRECSKGCEKNLFTDWKNVKIVLKFLYGTKILNKYENYFRKIFVDNYGKKTNKNSA